MTTVAVLGATSGIAVACQRQWARDGADFRLVARDDARLSRAGADLEARTTGSVATEVCDLGTPQGLRAALDFAFAEGAVDVLLVAFGTMPSQEEADADPATALELLHLNGTMAMLASHGAALRMIDAGSGSLVVLGSVAGDRGRKSNYLYGAAKAMVAAGVGGLQHRTAGTGVRITLVKPGPTATAMTDHLRGGPMRLAKVETVARDIVRGVSVGRPVVYTPRLWRVVMTVVRLLPRRVFERTNL